jgi:hypothetical protein
MTPSKFKVVLLEVKEKFYWRRDIVASLTVSARLRRQELLISVFGMETIIVMRGRHLGILLVKVAIIKLLRRRFI